jgi:benzoyl-CoA reductase/2-hydroxyglutaryl-CoA dehydratase subunit BcrC/BadD/HgdB
LELKSINSASPGDLEQYEKVLKGLKGRTISPSAESRVRVLLTGVPIPHGAERVMEILEDSGGLVVCQENCTGYKPVQEDVDETAVDLLQALAEKYYHLPCSVMTRNHRRMDQLRALAGEYRAECVIELIWQACLTYDVESSWVRRLAEEELSLPYLRLETDFSPSDSARIVLRVQSLYETVKGRKAFNH